MKLDFVIPIFIVLFFKIYEERFFERIRSGITVNDIEPENIMTEGLDDHDPRVVQTLKQAIPLGSFGT